MTTFDSVVFKFLNGIAGKYFLVDGVYIFFSEYLIYILTLVFGIYLFKIKYNSFFLMLWIKSDSYLHFIRRWR